MEWELIDDREQDFEKEVTGSESVMNCYLAAMVQDLLRGAKALEWLRSSIEAFYTDRLFKVSIEETGESSIRVSLFGRRGE